MDEIIGVGVLFVNAEEIKWDLTAKTQRTPRSYKVFCKRLRLKTVSAERIKQ